MIKKGNSPIPGHVRVVFELPSCIWADRIFLCGDFNNWRDSEIQLQQDRNGVWRTVLDLPLGKRYEFRYVIDGEWRTDSHADGQTDNSFGTQNSVVVAQVEQTEHIAPLRTGQVRERQVARSRGATVARPHPDRVTTHETPSAQNTRTKTS
ncbi:MAG: isoamylase early set domain-containing protein [Litorilinea sp.]